MELRDTSTPANIINFRKSTIGTKISLTLNAETSFVEKDFTCWLPKGETSAWLTIYFDGKKLEYPNTPSPSANAPLYFETKVFQKDTPAFTLELRANALKNEHGYISVCGLSFQSIDRMHLDINELPDVKFRTYNRGIPITNKDGHFPKYSGSERKNLLISKVFVPGDLNIKKPGLVSLNLSRTDFVKCKENDDFYANVDLALADLLFEYYDYLKNAGSPAKVYSNSLLEEYWLTYLQKNKLDILHDNSAGDPLIAKKLWPIFETSSWFFLKPDDFKMEERQLGNYINSDNPVVYLPPLLYKELMAKSKMPSLIKSLNNYLGDYSIILGTDSARDSLDPMQIVVNLATNVAFVDVLHLGIQLPPLAIYYFGKYQNTLQSTSKSAFVFGSKHLIYCFSGSRHIIGINRNAGADFIVNLNSNQSDIDDVLKNVNVRKMNFRPTPRNSKMDYLKSIGIPKKYLNSIYISPSCNFVVAEEFSSIRIIAI